MNSKIKKTLLLIFFSFSISFVYSQSNIDSLTKMKKVTIKMKNGDEYKGVFIQKTENTIILRTPNGDLHLIASNVSSITEDNYKGRFRFENSHDTRYFFGPSGKSIKRNKGYYQNLMLTSNFINYGVSDNISIGGGFEFISSILGYPVWFITPKVSFELSEDVNLAGGIFMAGFASEGTATLGYGVLTIGDSESNISFGTGYGFVSGEMSKRPTFMLSGTHRLNNSLALLSENYFISNYEGDYNLISVQGFRILSPKSSFDIGAFVIPNAGMTVFPIPFVGYARTF